MSEAVNAVNAAIVAAVAAGDSTAAFTREHLGPIHIDDLDAIENLDTAAIETIVSDSARLANKRPAEDDAEDIEDSVKLRKLQEEVNNNANALASKTLNSSGSNNGSAHTSHHGSGHNSPNHSSSLETHVPSDTAMSSPLTDSAAKTTSTTSGKVETRTSSGATIQVSPAARETLTSATTPHLSASSHSNIMADIERMRQLAKIDPTQLASYSTNPSNQATLEQLTSSALANVLAQAPLVASSLHSNLQLQQQHEQQHEDQQEAVHSILATVPATSADNGSGDSSSEHDDDDGPGKRSSRNMTNEERRQRRLLRNRVAAKECRKKKKAYVTELQDTCARLQEENSRLYKEVEELNAKLTLGAMRIDENVRLIKEVEELNAKLTLGVMAGTSPHVHDSLQEHSSVKLDDAAGELQGDETHQEVGQEVDAVVSEQS